MRKPLFFLLLFSILFSAAKAQWCADSALYASARFHPRGLVAPGLLISSGIAFHTVPPLTRLQTDLRDRIEASDFSPVRFDNFLQHLPIVSVYVLDLCGLQPVHSPRHYSRFLAEGYILGSIVLYTSKDLIPVSRPDGGNLSSFPSGHTFMAFLGAETLRREYGAAYPAAALAGYAVAAVTACCRVYNNRHWAADVLGGAGLGILASSTAYWINSRYLTRRSHVRALPGGISLSL